MQKYKAILFDMDGTLTDSAPGITRGVAYTLKKYGIEPPELDELKKFIGPPLGESFEKYYGIDRKNFLETERIFREYYDTTGIFENSLFDGVTEMLAGLKKADKFIATASSKPIMHVKRIIEHFCLVHYTLCIAITQIWITCFYHCFKVHRFILLYFILYNLCRLTISHER